MYNAQEQYQIGDTDTVLSHDSSPRYIMRVRDLPLAEKPREKLLASGAGGLTMAELVAVLWGVGTRKEEVMSMAQRLFREYGEKAMLHETSPTRLATALDIPLQKACQIIACLEIGRRFFATKSGQPVYVRTTQQAYSYLASVDSCSKEQLRGLYLNSRYQVVHDEVISVGSLTASIIHPREVFQPAITSGAVAVIVAHNHPSGDLTPTASDLDITAQLQEAGQILGIDLLDHLIITETAYVSILEKG